VSAGTRCCASATAPDARCDGVASAFAGSGPPAHAATSGAASPQMRVPSLMSFATWA